MLRADNKETADSLIIKLDNKNLFDSPNPPLILLNGKEITAEQMKQIKPADIERLEVFKDKDAKEKYGDKGKNGVLIITLKTK